MSKQLLIVESPTKAKTISKYLGKDYIIMSSFGHIRDLPKSQMGVDTEKDFEPSYIIPTKSKKNVADLKKAAASCSQILLATDEDREGEAIAWHIAEILKCKPDEVKRITFHEITKHAIEHAVENPRVLDMNLVNAQQARRILDRLVGYELSPLLWKKVQYGLSAGRVQSVAVRLIVERERERQAFNIEEFWSIDAEFQKENKIFDGKLTTIDGKKLDKLSITNKAQADEILAKLQDAKFTVDDVQKKQVQKAPPAPLTTSTLQQAANNAYGFSAKQTMTLAQKLYETGRITYMRTDSLNLADKFLAEAQVFISQNFGQQYAQGAKRYKTNKKGAQEAHEAIRPTDPCASTDSLNFTDNGMKKLYDLIWRRTLATQMPSAKLERTMVDISANNHIFRANGNIVVFDGFMKIYKAGKEKLLPELASGDKVENTKLEGVQHFTEPSARYSDATLVKAMEEFEIGRPSTYAPTIHTIVTRGYIDRDENKKLFPLDIAFIVIDLLVEHFPQIVDYKFTADMENSLDDVAEGKKDWVPMLKEFYGPFHKNIEDKSEHLKKEDVMKERVIGVDSKSGLEVIARMGRFGPYVQLGKYDKEKNGDGKEKLKSASLLKGMTIDTLTIDEAMELFKLPRTVGQTADGEDIVAAVGRFGPYLKAGKVTASIPADFDPLTISLEHAQGLIKESYEKKKEMLTPIAEFGNDPESGGQIVIKHGRFGPYITDGKTNVSIPKKIEPESVTQEQAIEMLEKKRKAPKRGKKSGKA
ncbi:MAG: type I DNA topoisomerase [Patescibacteria group bacterium]